MSLCVAVCYRGMLTCCPWLKPHPPTHFISSSPRSSPLYLWAWRCPLCLHISGPVEISSLRVSISLGMWSCPLLCVSIFLWTCGCVLSSVSLSISLDLWRCDRCFNVPAIPYHPPAESSNCRRPRDRWCWMPWTEQYVNQRSLFRGRGTKLTQPG